MNADEQQRIYEVEMEQKRRDEFDARVAEQARNDGIRRVDFGAEEEWKEAAYDAVVRAARIHPEGFIADVVWQLIPERIEAPREPRALGAVMRRASRAGVIVPTDQFVPSDRVTAHRNPRRIWKAA